MASLRFRLWLLNPPNPLGVAMLRDRFGEASAGADVRISNVDCKSGVCCANDNPEISMSAKSTRGYPDLLNFLKKPPQPADFSHNFPRGSIRGAPLGGNDAHEVND